MTIGFIGLGKMGKAMALRLLKSGVKVVAYNRSPDPYPVLRKAGAVVASSAQDVAMRLKGRKIIWLMLPAGGPTGEMIKKLISRLNKGDIIVDGANEFYRVAEEYGKRCKTRGIYYFDCGVSGGVWGYTNGYTLMVGGSKSQFSRIEPLCRILAPKGGYGYFGETGSGFFVKSVHNVIEYIVLQGLAEGVELLSRFKRPIDVQKAVSVWRPASVVRSWLLDLTDAALRRPDFGLISATINSVTMHELNQTTRALKAYTPAFDAAVKTRKDRSGRLKLGKRVIAAVRREFGGHGVIKK